MDNVTKIRRVSTALIYACYFVMAFWVIFIYATLFNVFRGRDAFADYLPDALVPTLQRMMEASYLVSIPASIIYFIPTAIWLYAIWRFIRLLRLFENGTYFSTEGANHLFVFSLLCCLVHVISTPMLGVADYVLTIGNELDPYGMPVMINGDEITMLVYYTMFLVVSWILREAIKIAKENAEFV